MSDFHQLIIAGTLTGAVRAMRDGARGTLTSAFARVDRTTGVPRYEQLVLTLETTAPHLARQLISHAAGDRLLVLGQLEARQVEQVEHATRTERGVPVVVRVRHPTLVLVIGQIVPLLRTDAASVRDLQQLTIAGNLRETVQRAADGTATGTVITRFTRIDLTAGLPVHERLALPLEASDPYHAQQFCQFRSGTRVLAIGHLEPRFRTHTVRASAADGSGAVRVETTTTLLVMVLEHLLVAGADADRTHTADRMDEAARPASGYPPQ